MPRWASSRSRVWLAALRYPSSQRCYSTIQKINVTCASSGSISVHLHNVDQHDASHPLMIWIPPFPQEPGSSHNEPASLLPSWLRPFPTAVINYRWAGLNHHHHLPNQNESSSDSPSPSPSPLHWPTPLHDVLFGYTWIQKNLAPPYPTHRDIYIVSSYLGASLAAGLALTESHSSSKTAVRGLINFNGIYNWTTFLPDHPIHKPAKTKKGGGGSTLLSQPFTSTEPDQESSLFSLLRQQTPALFNSPEHLFDPFASACLFFHSADLFVPADFHTPRVKSDMSRAIDALANSSLSTPTRKMEGDYPPVPPIIEKPPRKGYLTFPPRNSSLVLPSTLLLHETTPPKPVPNGVKGKAKGKAKGRAKASVRFGGKYTGENNFQTQANELAALMRRSINMFELKQRIKWDGAGDELDEEDGGAALAESVAESDEAAERVQVGDVGLLSSEGLDAAFGPCREDGKDIGLEDGGDFGLTRKGQDILEEWLADRM
ncbi:hypothetical protein V8F20_003411 [Naviculisporaceae sp. PSN 640]